MLRFIKNFLYLLFYCIILFNHLIIVLIYFINNFKSYIFIIFIFWSLIFIINSFEYIKINFYFKFF